MYGCLEITWSIPLMVHSLCVQSRRKGVPSTFLSAEENSSAELMFPLDLTLVVQGTQTLKLAFL